MLIICASIGQISFVGGSTSHQNKMAAERRGRPAVFVDEDQVLALKAIGFSWKKIANLIGVSDRTLRERRKELKMEKPIDTELNRQLQHNQ